MTSEKVERKLCHLCNAEKTDPSEVRTRKNLIMSEFQIFIRPFACDNIAEKLQSTSPGERCKEIVILLPQRALEALWPKKTFQASPS